MLSEPIREFIKHSYFFQDISTDPVLQQPGPMRRPHQALQDPTTGQLYRIKRDRGHEAWTSACKEAHDLQVGPPFPAILI